MFFNFYISIPLGWSKRIRAKVARGGIAYEDISPNSHLWVTKADRHFYKHSPWSRLAKGIEKQSRTGMETERPMRKQIK